MISAAAGLTRLLAGVAVFFLIGSLVPRAAAAEDLIDHMGLLEQLGAETVREVLDQVPLTPGASVHVVPETYHPANWLLARLLERELLARGHIVIAFGFGRENGVPAAAPGAEPAAAEKPRGTKVRGAGAAAAGEPAGPGGEEAGGTTEEGGETGQPGETLDAEGEPQDEEAATGAAGAEGDAGSGEEQSEPAVPSTPGEGAGEGEPAGEPSQAAPAGGAQPAGTGFAFELPPHGEVIAFRVLECGVRYPWAKRSLWVGSRRIGRLATVKLWATLLSQPGHQVKSTASSERVHLDTIPGWARSYVEGQGYPFPIEAPPGGSLGRFIEPVAVAGIVSGLVYLFVQNQK